MLGHIMIIMTVVTGNGDSLMVSGRRNFCNYARAHAVPGAKQDRQRGEECRFKSASDHALTNLSKVISYTPNGYMSIMESHV